jgi:Sec-independent protein translocase protein TatA
MDFLGIGPLEIIFIVIIVLVIFGPNDLAKTGKAAGKFLRKVVTSPGWQAIQDTSKEIRNLPNRLIREAGLDEIEQDMETIKRDVQRIEDEVKRTAPSKAADRLEKDLPKGKNRADLAPWVTPAAPQPAGEGSQKGSDPTPPEGETLRKGKQED